MTGTVSTGREIHPVLPLLPPEVEKAWLEVDPKKVDEFYALRKESMRMEQADPFRHGFEPEIWKIADEALAKKRDQFPVGVIEELDLGGNRACLVEGSRIYDPVTGKRTAIEKLTKSFHVLAFDNGWWVTAEAEPAFTRGNLPCVRIRLSNGQECSCSRTHRVLTSVGWRQASELRSGQLLVGALPVPSASIWGTGQQASPQDDLRWTETTQDCSENYSACSRLYDELPHLVSKFGQSSSPSLSGAAEHRSFVGSIVHLLSRLFSRWRRHNRDALDNRLQDTRPTYVNPLSILDDRGQSAGQFSDTLSPLAYTPCKSVWPLFEGRYVRGGCRRSKSESYPQRSSYEYLAPDKRYDSMSAFDTITTEVISIQDIGEHECFDFHVPGYENYMHAGVCHHNSKTERIAKRLVQLMVNKPGAKVWFLQSTQTISRQSQQPIVWKYIPQEWKPVGGRSKRDLISKINYTQAGGFTEDTFVLPNGSQGWFKFYSVSVTDVEGPELDAAWPDELVTPEWLEFLRYRLVTRNGVLSTTFTPVEGYSATVKTYLDNAKTIEEMDAELLPIRDETGEVKTYEKVPRIQQPENERAIVVYFHTADNPYGNYPSMRETLKGKPRETILMRAYGVPSKTSGAAFPMFRYNVHVISTARFMDLVQKHPNGTRYHLVDPCSGRNWFQIWLFCPYPGKKIIYREWPSYTHLGAYIPGVGDPGPWTIAGKAEDGERGPAQKAFGFGLERYKQEIDRLEKGEEMLERFMDARTANAPTATREGTTTLIEQMDELGMTFRGSASEKNVFSSDGDGSIDLLNSDLYYDLDVPLGEFSPSLARLNEPRLQIVETCPNVIYSLSNWTGKDGQHGAAKDPVDVCRMMELNELDCVTDSMLRPVQPWKQQFRNAA